MIRQMLIYRSLNDEKAIAIPFEDCTSIILKEQLSNNKIGYENLTIVFPLDNPLSKYFKNERDINIIDRRFVIKKITKQKSSSNLITIYCESFWYQLNEGELMPTNNPFNNPVSEVITWFLQDSKLQWATTSPPSLNKTVYGHMIKGQNALYNLKFLAGLANGELLFSLPFNEIPFVYIVDRVGKDKNIVVSYRSNLQGITRIDDSTNLCTRIFMYGENGIDISSINGGLPYLEDYSFFDQNNLPRRIMSKTITDERFNVLTSMRDYMLNYLSIYSKLFTSYEITQTYLNEILNVGDSIIVNDADLGINASHRVVERTVDLINIENSVYILDNVIDNLTSSLLDENLYLPSTDTNI